MRISVLHGGGATASRAARVASELKSAGHSATVQARGRSVPSLASLLRQRPQMIHICGAGRMRTAGLARRLLRAGIVFEPLAEAEEGEPTRRLTRAASALARRCQAVVAADPEQAEEARSLFGLEQLPIAVGGVEQRGVAGEGRMLAALYDRLPDPSSTLAPGRTVAPLSRARSLISGSFAPLHYGALRHPLSWCRYLRGRWLRHAGRPAPAAAALDRAWRGDSRNPVYAIQRAIAAREARMPDLAASALRDASRRLEVLRPRELGQVGIELARADGRTEAAAVVRRLRGRAAEEGPGSPAEALALAAQVSTALGDLEAARELALAAAAAPIRGASAGLATVLALERACEPTRALELARDQGIRGQRRRLAGLLRATDSGWAPRLEQRRLIPAAGPQRVLCLLESSLPQAPSGYAYRSRTLLAAVAGAGAAPIVATRLGFPASRGIPDWAMVECVDEVVHHRFNLAQVSSYSGIPLDRRQQLNAERLLELAKRIRPGLTIAASPQLNGALGRALRLATGAPLVYDVRGFPEMTLAATPGGSETELYRLRRQAETRCASEADAVITLSETMREELVGRGVDPSKVRVVPHVAAPAFDRARERDLSLSRSLGLDGRTVVGCVSSLVDYEGIDVLLEALVRARESQPNLATLIVGDGPARRSLEALSRRLGLEDVVVFTGRVDHDLVPDHYALLDLVAIPRLDLEVCRRVTPLKPVEALAAGAPIVASDLPALAEVVSASGAGRLVPPGSPERLAEAVVELAGDPDLRAALSSAASKYARASHTQAVAETALESALAPLLD